MSLLHRNLSTHYKVKKLVINELGVKLTFP